ncbi:MAG: 16S rRNA (guanine(527)-N(7))-methyltransferase RsmG [Desulfobulbaceae bacterium]|nr:16S rRNA (guanine(527)-N(7))-methyltransferase RsmG [Desulfobulbaceae bacterium]
MGFNFSALLQNGLDHLGLEVSGEGFSQLERYFLELKKWQRKVNLIAKSATDSQIVENHFLDSLTLLPSLCEPECHLLDIGTGGGFPGLVCKSVLPELKLTLVEPRLKRVSFLKHIVRTLDLHNVAIHADRLENTLELCDDKSISHITCRAVTEIGPFLQMVESFSSTGAKVIIMKGPRWQEELKAAGEIVAGSAFQLSDTVECSLPFSGAKRCLVSLCVK